MTDYKIFNTLYRTAIAFILIGALFTAPLLAAAAECSFLPAEFHAAATEAADRFEDELRLELAENIRLPTVHTCRPSFSPEGFSRLVTAFGLDYGRLLDAQTVLAELDAKDLEILPLLTTHDVQLWAELLAFRLTRGRGRCKVQT